MVRKLLKQKYVYMCVSVTSASRCGLNLAFFLAPLELGKGLEFNSEVKEE